MRRIWICSKEQNQSNSFLIQFAHQLSIDYLSLWRVTRKNLYIHFKAPFFSCLKHNDKWFLSSFKGFLSSTFSLSASVLILWKPKSQWRDIFWCTHLYLCFCNQHVYIHSLIEVPLSIGLACLIRNISLHANCDISDVLLLTTRWRYIIPPPVDHLHQIKKIYTLVADLDFQQQEQQDE